MSSLATSPATRGPARFLIAPAALSALVTHFALSQPTRPDATTWTDPTVHRSTSIRMTEDVVLHTLSFGGPASGPPIVFLAGVGNTAHAWDSFAPRFTKTYRVFALTRRGFGESSHPRSGYDLTTRVEDIRIALDSLHIAKAILVGHSIAGEE